MIHSLSHSRVYTRSVNHPCDVTTFLKQMLDFHWTCHHRTEKSLTRTQPFSFQEPGSQFLLDTSVDIIQTILKWILFSCSSFHTLQSWEISLNILFITFTFCRVIVWLCYLIIKTRASDSPRPFQKHITHSAQWHYKAVGRLKVGLWREKQNNATFRSQAVDMETSGWADGHDHIQYIWHDRVELLEKRPLANHQKVSKQIQTSQPSWDNSHCASELTKYTAFLALWWYLDNSKGFCRCVIWNSSLGSISKVDRTW